MYPNLKAEASKKCISQAALADAAGVTTRTIYNWFHTDSEMTYSQAVSIKKLFPDQKIDELLEFVQAGNAK